MANTLTITTTAPGLVTLNPIQGLVDYVNVIKPYHSKIFEVDFEIMWTENVMTTVVDTNVWTINSTENDNAETTVTEFAETIAFNWSGNNSYTIAGVDLGASQVTVTGNLTTAIMAQDITEVVGSIGNPTILDVTYDPTSNLTTITFDSLPVTTSIGNTLIVQNIDVTPWYQFTIISVNTTDTAPSQSPNAFAQTNTNNVIFGIQPGIVVPGVPSITVLGNATVDIQPGSVFQIQGSSGNNGIYYAVYVQYEPIANTTTIGVGSTLGLTILPSVATGGGIVVPYRFLGETNNGTYDSGGYDAGPYDESVGSVIHLA
jgi:hypothetical protein